MKYDERGKIDYRRICKAIFEEGRYIVYENGVIQRTSDKTFIKLTSCTSKYNWSAGDRGNFQYTLYTQQYGMVAITLLKLLKYGESKGLLKPLNPSIPRTIQGVQQPWLNDIV